MELLLILAILVLVAAFVTVPLRRPARRGETERDADLAELEARKESKYREIRDTEVDLATGKLSEEEWRRQNDELRGEAIEILRQIDELDSGG